MKRKLSIVMVAVLLVIGISTGCSSSNEKQEKSNKTNQEGAISLEGENLAVYCGAGMTKPFEEIANKFKEETNCNIEVTYANAAQIQSQINTSEEGDLFIAGSKEEIEPVKDKVSESKDLVKHIPVLAIESGNPKEINGLSDLTKDNISVVLGDYDSTPIGKIAKKALGDVGIFNKINVVANTSTAPELINALVNKEADATIVWKENTNNDKVEIVNTTDLDNYIKTIPAASLSCSENEESLKAFLEFLDTDTAKDIWTSYGYELLK